MTDRPTLALPPKWCCLRHERRAVLVPSISRVAWPLALLTLCLEDGRVQRRAGYDLAAGTRADPTELSRILGEIGPLCCFLPAEKLRESYEIARGKVPSHAARDPNPSHDARGGRA